MNKQWKIKFSFLFGILFFKDPGGVRRGPDRDPFGPLKTQSFRRFWTSHYNAYKQYYEHDNSELYKKSYWYQIILIFQSALFICKKSFEQWTNNEK